MSGERTVKIKFTGDATGVKKASTDGEQAVGGFAKSVDKASNTIKVGMVAAGAAIAAALGAAVGAGLEQSQIKAKLAAQLGATGPAAKTAGDAAGALYARGVVGSMEEAADAVKAIFQNGLVPANAGQKEVDQVAARVSTLATLLDEDANSVSRAVSQMLRTGVAKSSQEAFDILARGAQLGINKSEDLLDTFNEYGTQFRKLGLSGPEALGLLSQALKGGARDSDLAADALKEFSIRAVDGSKLSAEGFKALGLDAKEMTAQIAEGGDAAEGGLYEVLSRLREIKDPVKQASAATALFGTQAEDLGKALFAMDPGTAAKGIGQLAGAADAAGKTLEQSAGAKVQAFQRMLQGQLVVALAATVGWLQRNQELVKTLAIVLGPIAAIIAVIVAAVKIWTIVQTALNFVLTANPIGLVVAGIALLIAGIVLIATKTKFFQTIWGAVWGFIKDTASSVASFFQNVIFPFFVNEFNKLKMAIQSVGNFFVAAGNVIAGAIRFVYNVHVAVVKLIIAVIRSIASAVVDVSNKIRVGFNTVVSFIAGLPDRIKSAARGLFDGVKDAFRSAINWIIDKWNNLSFSLPSVNTPFGKIGGTTLSTPNIQHLASGGWMQPGKTYLTSENGPELLSTGRRAFVTNAGDTAAALGTPPEVHVYIGDRELTDMIDVQITTNNRNTRRRVGARPAGGFA